MNRNYGAKLLLKKLLKPNEPGLKSKESKKSTEENVRKEMYQTRRCNFGIVLSRKASMRNCSLLNMPRQTVSNAINQFKELRVMIVGVREVADKHPLDDQKASGVKQIELVKFK